mgnify:CR=1 FL=1
MGPGGGGRRTPPPPIGARSPFQRAPGAPRGLLMAACKWASTGLGWGGGLSRLRTRSAAPWDGDSTPKLPPAAYSTASQPLPPPKGCTIGHIAPPPTGSRAGARRGRLGARTARKVRTSTAARPPQGCRAAVLASQGAHRLIWLLRRRPLRWPLLRRLAGGTAAGGRCTRAFPRGRRRAARAQLCWHTARVVTQPRRTGGAVREARAISYF